MAIITTTVSSEKELLQILDLQQKNLLSNTSAETQQQQGFVTIHHTLPVLKQMNSLAPSIIAKEGDELAGYALMMPQECKLIIPGLVPMFALFDTIIWKKRALRDLSFYVMGQICVGEAWRGQGVFDALYHQHKKTYGHVYDCIVTEIATRNLRSMKAHERVGFETIHIHKDELDEWAVVAWDWS